MKEATMLVSIALFWVYMKRHGRWTDFFGALEGKYSLGGSG